MRNMLCKEKPEAGLGKPGESWKLRGGGRQAAMVNRGKENLMKS